MNNQSNKLSPSDVLSYCIHQDSLMWSRLQTIGVVQVGALSAAYALQCEKWLSLSIILLGIMLTLLVFFLLKRDELVRTANEKLLCGLNFTRPRRWYAPLKGREVAWIIVGVLLLSDAAFAYVVHIGNSCGN